MSRARTAALLVSFVAAALVVAFARSQSEPSSAERDDTPPAAVAVTPQRGNGAEEGSSAQNLERELDQLEKSLAEDGGSSKALR